jgi:hypothetical protein
VNFRVGTANIALNRSDSLGFARTIEIHASADATGSYRRAIIHFYGPEVGRLITDIGYRQIGPGDTYLLVAILPLTDFQDACLLLQSGGPVRVSWELGDADKLRSFRIDTDIGSGL